LLRISQANAILLRNWKEGISIEQSSGCSIEDLALGAAAYRWRLAVEHRRQANAILRLSRPLYRAATSRLYYAMYHAIRAAAYVSHGGDDHQEHAKLPSNTPVDFPAHDQWENALKSAREHRNQADYDPHPLADHVFRPIAIQLKSDADQLLPIARRYLLAKGCRL
jgi:uncharacterized protein (UPF0332 family)